MNVIINTLVGVNVLLFDWTILSWIKISYNTPAPLTFWLFGYSFFMKQLDLNLLFLFITLYQEGSTKKTALKLNRSQSYVSKALAQLREELDEPLFIRTATGLVPTSYASNIAPKVKEALALMYGALKPELFDPLTLDKVTVHLATPFIIPIGKRLITAIRQHTPAIIELREWHLRTESLLLDEQVDLAVHAIIDRPQSLYQKKVMSICGSFTGNQQGEFVKTIIDNFNEHKTFCSLNDAKIQPSIIIDNQYLAGQLMDEHFSYGPTHNLDQKSNLTDIALICKAASRNSPKVQWLMDLCAPIVKETQW
jgi:hypothetical protein